MIVEKLFLVPLGRNILSPRAAEWNCISYNNAKQLGGSACYKINLRTGDWGQFQRE